MDRKQEALSAFSQGCNCCQAVVTAFADEIGLSKEEARRLFEGFGGGIGGLREACGAFTGATAVIGYLNSDGSENARTKRDTNSKIQKLGGKFVDQFGSLRCGEILKENSKKNIGCSDVVAGAVELVEDYMNGR